jgi:hypothetical protein
MSEKKELIMTEMTDVVDVVAGVVADVVADVVAVEVTKTSKMDSEAEICFLSFRAQFRYELPHFSWATDPKFRTVLLRRTHQRTYVQNFSSLGAIPAEK